MIPSVTAAQMREIDRIMVEDLRIGLVQMMENAGRALALRARRMIGHDLRSAHVVVLAGSGGNGGGGIAAARRLAIWGAHVTLALAQPARDMAVVPRQQLEIAERIGISVNDHARFDGADLIIDGLIGYSLRGRPRERITRLIRDANGSGVPILALDIPSGLDPDTGEASEPTIRARSTLTLALPKVGLLTKSAREWVGELYLADISVPDLVYQKLGIAVGPIFARSDVIRVDVADP